MQARVDLRLIKIPSRLSHAYTTEPCRHFLCKANPEVILPWQGNNDPTLRVHSYIYFPKKCPSDQLIYDFMGRFLSRNSCSTDVQRLTQAGVKQVSSRCHTGVKQASSTDKVKSPADEWPGRSRAVWWWRWWKQGIVQSGHDRSQRGEYVQRIRQAGDIGSRGLR